MLDPDSSNNFLMTLELFVAAHFRKCESGHNVIQIKFVWQGWWNCIKGARGNVLHYIEFLNHFMQHVVLHVSALQTDDNIFFESSKDINRCCWVTLRWTQIQRWQMWIYSEVNTWTAGTCTSEREHADHVLHSHVKSTHTQIHILLGSKL